MSQKQTQEQTESKTQPKASRRSFMKILGGGTIVAAAGVGGYLATRTPAKAIEPWKLALGPKAGRDPRHVVLSHAILAPNPHNRQPWVADLSVQDEITLFCDLDRRLPHTDPFDRQITIGLGCFTELLELTAKEIGYRTEIGLFPDGEPTERLDERPVATIRLVKDEAVSPDPLFTQIFDRRSNKEPYDVTKSVAKTVANQLLSVAKHGTSVGKILDDAQVQRLSAIAWDAMDTEMRTYRTAKESIDLLRIGKGEIEANPDGIDLGGAFFETMDLLGLMNRDAMLDTGSMVFEGQMKAMKEPFETATGFIYVKTQGNSRKDQIASGRDYVRLNLKATELGIAMQPWSQALQEYEEVQGSYREIRNELGVSSAETLQMFARIGYGEETAPSPRWPYETRIRNA